jgi:hypothetical protein
MEVEEDRAQMHPHYESKEFFWQEKIYNSMTFAGRLISQELITNKSTQLPRLPWCLPAQSPALRDEGRGKTGTALLLDGGRSIEKCQLSLGRLSMRSFNKRSHMRVQL